MIPGEMKVVAGDIELNKGRKTVTVEVTNTGDRPVQVGSHYHFFETNDALRFDRKAAYGFRLNIAAGTAVRFEPGQTRTVRAGGARGRSQGLRLPGQGDGSAQMKISRQAYAEMFGPTTGDRVRLADTELWIEVEKDFTIYGEEVKFGGGKVIRDGMGQSQRLSAEVADTIITNALIVDHWGIVKADVGIEGRAHLEDRQGRQSRHPAGSHDSRSAPGTEVIAGEGMILTAGGIDSHIHFICPQQIDEALMSGVTTMLGGGTGPATGTFATTCTPGPWHMHAMLSAAEAFPMNLGFLGKGNASLPGPLREQVTRGRDRIEAARGLGHDARGDRQLPRRSPTRWTCRSRSTPTR